MKTSRLLSLLSSVLLAALCSAALAVFDPVNDDTDIFLANPNIPGSRPNVLIMIDNTANWNTIHRPLMQALRATVSGLDDRFNVGVGLFPETGSQQVDGMYLYYAIRQMTPANKAALLAKIGTDAATPDPFDDGLSKLGFKGSQANYAPAMDEIFNYFAGLPSRSGATEPKVDVGGFSAYDGSTSPKTGTYASPVSDGCQKNFVIFISNGPASDASSLLATVQGYLATITGTDPPYQIDLAKTIVSGSPINDDASEVNWADEYSRWMANQDCNAFIGGVQNVFTYTVEIAPGSNLSDKQHTRLLKSMASEGKGRYILVTDTSSSTQIEEALNSVFTEVQAVNSVFASIALPVSVNVRGTNLNQVYIGVFRPDPDKGPRWFGNLKMYKLAKVGEDVYLTDSSTPVAPNPPTKVENPVTGFMSPLAQSFWSTTTATPFWNHRTDDENGGPNRQNDAPDGDIVEKGGAAQRLRTRHATDQASRRLFTCINSSGGLCTANAAMPEFTDANADVTAPDIGAYVSFPVAQIEASGTTATVTMSGTSPDTWSAAADTNWAGTTVKIEGAPVAAYNLSKPISNLNTTTRTFQYTLDVAQPSDTGRATHVSVKHGLVTGDLVSITGATPTEFNVTNAAISRIDDFIYRFPAAGASGVAGGTPVVTGKKFVSSIVGVGTNATMTIPAHLYGANGSTVTLSVTGATETMFNVTNATATIVDANTVTYSTSPTSVAGTVATALATTSIAHGFTTGQQITIKNATETEFNGNFTLTTASGTTFGFTPTAGTVALDTTAGMVAGIRITQITHPETGGSQNVATFTTAGPHGLAIGSATSVTISGTGGIPANSSSGRYDGTFNATGVTSTTFTIQATNFNRPPTPLTTVGMLLNSRTVTQIAPSITATGTIYSAKQVAVSTISSVNFMTGSITAGRTADNDPVARTALIEWIRGRDNLGAREKSNATPPNVRPSIHGDVLHGRPAVVNYGRGTVAAGNFEDDITVFYGGNDGIFRAVKAGTATVAGDVFPSTTTMVEPGDERWGFIPKEFFSRYKRLRTQTPPISNSNPRDYFADGAVSVYTKDGFSRDASNAIVAVPDGKLVAADGDKVYLFISMRRGGDFIYALDVSDPNVPKLLWKKGAGDTGYGILGQTWSEPKVARVKATLGAHNPENVVLIFGGGYEKEVEDFNPCLLEESSASAVKYFPAPSAGIVFTAAGSCTFPAIGSASKSRSKGRGIMVVDAINGSVFWQAAGGASAPTGATHNLHVTRMTHAIPADLRILDLNGDGLVDAAFAGDTGGQVWRVDLTDANPAKWMVRLLATMQTGADTVISGKRKFMNTPEVTLGQDSTGIYLGVQLGSGDREHPFDTIVENRFYAIKDRGVTGIFGSGTGVRSWTIADGNTSTSGTSYGAGMIVTDADVAAATLTSPAENQSGFKLAYALGEKTVSAALTVAGETFFSTNQPGSVAGLASCVSNLGVARIYRIGFSDGGGTATVQQGGGYIPSPVYAAVVFSSGSSGSSSSTTTSTGACVGAACATNPGGPTDTTLTPTGVVCFGPFCFSTGKVDIGSRRRAYWYKEID
jgi:type IV pilus assembly protein PilY1